MNAAERRQQWRVLAAELVGVDREVYAAYGRDPLEPIAIGGDPAARIALFGRDPGRHEVEHLMPFIGAGGQKVRRVLFRRLRGPGEPSPGDLVEIGRYVFWANTVPYKPIENRPWSRTVIRRFQPLTADLLVHEWRGSDVITLGQEAFSWFGLADRDTSLRLQEHWRREERFETSIDVEIAAPDGERATYTLHPLPHPSPLNAAWFAEFPRLLEDRLAALGLSERSWRVPGGGDRPRV